MSKASTPWVHPSPVAHLDKLLMLEGKRVLDVGCGGGWLVRYAAERGADVTGLECGAAMLQQAAHADADHLDRYVEGVGQDLPFADESFDVVTFMFSLHHVPPPEMGTALVESARVLRPGGRFYVIEPVAAGLGHEVDALMDDETDVRLLAQQAVDRCAGGYFDELEPVRYLTYSSYVDVADYEAVCVGIDPERAKDFDDVRAAITARFYENASEHNGRWWFEDQILARSFIRR